MGLPVVCLIYGALTIRLGSLARLPEMTFIMYIELFIALVSVAILKKVFPRIRIMVLILVQFFICLVIGWYVGYKIGLAVYARPLWYAHAQSLNQNDLDKLTEQQKEIIQIKITSDPQLYVFANKIAAHNSIPATIILSGFIYIFIRRKWSATPAILKD